MMLTQASEPFVSRSGKFECVSPSLNGPDALVIKLVRFGLVNSSMARTLRIKVMFCVHLEEVITLPCVRRRATAYESD